LEQHQLLSKSETAKICKFSIATLERRIADGDGPRKIQLSPRRVAFRLADVLAWIERRAGADDAA
jgi:predicted DNA-binding transcriptional regulator AlpA